MEKKIVYIDLDGVTADFFAALGRVVNPTEEPTEIYEKGFYRNMPVMEGAKEAIQTLLENENLDVYFASKPATNSKYCENEKKAWVNEHFPELRKKLFLIPNKNLLSGHYLIDDHPFKWSGFGGEVIHFDPLNPVESWIRVIGTIGAGNE